MARFHLDNGARLERLNANANLSAKGLKQSAGLMVNYLYDLSRVETCHDRFVHGRVVHSRALATLLCPSPAAQTPASSHPQETSMKHKHAPLRRHLLLAAALAATTVHAPSALAQAWPTKPVNIVVPLPPPAAAPTPLRGHSPPR